MKPKVFRDVAWPAFLVIEIFCILLLLFIMGVSINILLLEKDSLLQGVIPFYLFVFELLWVGGGGGFVFVCFVNSSKILDRALGRLLIYDDRVVFKCPLRITREIAKQDCNYIGVEDYQALNRGMPTVRGDETSFVYFSNTPYPEKYKNKISLLKNNKSFIKFSYSDRLAITIMEEFTKEKCNFVKAFYGQMQANDRMMKQKKRKK